MEQTNKKTAFDISFFLKNPLFQWHENVFDREGQNITKYRRFRYSFICQGISTRRQRSDLFGFRVLPV